MSMSTTHASPTDVRRPHVNLWLVAVIVLSAGLVALGTWTLVDRYTGSTSDAAQLIDRLNTAVNAGDAKAVRALFTSDAVVQAGSGPGSLYAEGREKAVNAALIPHSVGLRLKRVAPVSSEGDYAATFVQWRNGGVGVELIVFQFRDGKIVEQRIFPNYG